MPDLQHDFSFPDTSGNGVALVNITVVLLNRRNEPKVTLGPATPPSYPSWLSLVSGSPNVVYRLTTSVPDQDFPPDFALMRVTGTTESDGVLTRTEVIPFVGSAVPEAEPGREPYSDQDWADTYFGTKLGAEDWFGYSDRQKFMALMTASDDLDREVYKGQKSGFYITGAPYSAFRFRQFPRYIPEFAFPIPQLTSDSETASGVYPDVKRACCVQALFLLRQLAAKGQDPHERRTAQQFGLSGFQAGRLAESWDMAHRPNDRICPEARDLLRPYLLVAANIGFFDIGV